MKTNRFDNILRRKLESIQPDFQDQDWEKWQAFRQHATPTFWQAYGHWLGYAVAALTTAVMVVLYSNQSTQNDELLKEMQALKQQITSRNSEGVPQAEPSRVPLYDTVYIVERRNVYVDRPVSENESIKSLSSTSAVPSKKARKNTGSTDRNDLTEYEEKKENLGQGTLLIVDNPTRPENVGETSVVPQGTLPITPSISESSKEVEPAKPRDAERLDLGEIVALPTLAYSPPATDVYRRLQSRMPRATKSTLAGQRVAKSENLNMGKRQSEVPVSPQKEEKIGQDERLLPAFGLGLPYRIGVGQQWEGRTKAFGIWNEVLLGKHWSVQTGISWQKLENQKFYTDRIFRDKTHQDFRKQHAKPLPPNFDIFNITVATTLLRVPLSLNYRYNLGSDFTYFVGAGTQLNVQAKQRLSFDFKRPTNDFGQEVTIRKVPFQFVNNANVQAGLEKRWSPIVVQASAALDTRFKPYPYLSTRTSLGVQVKLLYELGTTKKK